MCRQYFYTLDSNFVYSKVLLEPKIHLKIELYMLYVFGVLYEINEKMKSMKLGPSTLNHRQRYIKNNSKSSHLKLAFKESAFWGIWGNSAI